MPRIWLKVVIGGIVASPTPTVLMASLSIRVTWTSLGFEHLGERGGRHPAGGAAADDQDLADAEDIGALPDRSVTETLQRIPGVAINRFAAGVDPDHFSVEGSGVVVRGLTYVRSEFNGREAFSANNGRALSFADVPSELMGGVDVFKSPSADRIEGGIAGVVNLRTRKPFDAKGFVLAASAEMNYGDFQKDPSANLNVLISNRWQTGIGEIGFLASASYSNLKSRADRLQVSSFRIRNLYSDGDVNANGGTTVAGRVLFPRGAAIGTQEFDRTRYGYSAAAQWRSNDGSMEAVFQFLRSDARQAWNEHTVEIATDNVSNNGDSRRVPGTTLQFDDDGLFASGTITGPTGWRADQNQQNQGILARVPMLGLQSNNIQRSHTEKLVTDDYGFNFKWDVSDRLGVTVDYQHVQSSSYILDNTLWNTTYQNASIQLNGSDYPNIQFLPPQVCSGPAANSQNPPGTDNDCAGFGAALRALRVRNIRPLISARVTPASPIRSTASRAPRWTMSRTATAIRTRLASISNIPSPKADS
jgi:TonB-dependent receptor